MRLFAAFISLLAIVIVSPDALAQSKAPRTQGTETLVQYFDLSPHVLIERDAEILLRETRKGAALVAAELELCLDLGDGNHQFDRAVLPMQIKGGRFVGSGRTQRTKRAVRADIVRTVFKGELRYAGLLSIGEQTRRFEASETVGISQQDYRDVYQWLDRADARPTEFLKAVPHLLNVRVSREGLSPLLQALRPLNVRMSFSDLEVSCKVLRTGHHVIALEVNPEHASEILSAVRRQGGVAFAGFAWGSPPLDQAVRFLSKDWRDAAGAIAREQLSGAVTSAISKALGAELVSPSGIQLLAT